MHVVTLKEKLMCAMIQRRDQANGDRRNESKRNIQDHSGIRERNEIEPIILSTWE